MVHQSKGIAKTKKTAYQDYRNLNLFERKSGESVKVKVLERKFRKLELLGPVGINATSC